MKSWKVAGVAAGIAMLGVGVWAMLAFGANDETAGPIEKVHQEIKTEQAGEELMLVEGVESSRKSYEQALNKLIDFYLRTNNDYKLKQAKKELDSFRAIKRYNYVMVPQAMSDAVKPTKDIPEATKVFADARQYDTTPDIFNIDRNKRLALERYNEVISRFPESVKCPDAAYYAGVIYEENLKDYYRACVYFEKCYQWEPKTPQPALIRAARIYFNKLDDYREARRVYDLAAANAPNKADREEAAKMVEKLKKLGF